MGPIVIVGAGIAGVSCARVLKAAGLDVEVLDRGRRIGGRMASRRLGNRPTDLGAAFFTVSDPRFAEVVAGWEQRGLARPWTETLSVITTGSATSSTSGPMRWGTPGGIRSVVEDLAVGLRISTEQVMSVSLDSVGRFQVCGRSAAAVVLAMPDPQARVLLGGGTQHLSARLDMDYDPVLALAAWWPQRVWDAAAGAGLPRFEGAFVNEDQELAWVADDGRRRGDGAAVLVAHSTPEFASGYLFEPEAAAPSMTAALRRVLDIRSDPQGHYLQRWSVARPTRVRAEPYWLSEENLGFCGDGWGRASRVEGAFLSGLELGQALVARFR